MWGNHWYVSFYPLCVLTTRRCSPCQDQGCIPSLRAYSVFFFFCGWTLQSRHFNPKQPGTVWVSPIAPAGVSRNVVKLRHFQTFSRSLLLQSPTVVGFISPSKHDLFFQNNDHLLWDTVTNRLAERLLSPVIKVELPPCKDDYKPVTLRGSS